jgi:hypothetical protein
VLLGKQGQTVFGCEPGFWWDPAHGTEVGRVGARFAVRLLPMARVRRPACVMAPPSLLWATRADGLVIECLARLYAGGVYVEIRVDGAPTIGRTFVTSDEAISFSEHQCQLWDDPSGVFDRLK